jgi:hypothetical protein
MIPFCAVFAFVNFVLDATIRPLLDTHQEQAYFVMFETLDCEIIARDDVKFIAVDLSGVLLEDTFKLVITTTNTSVVTFFSDEKNRQRHYGASDNEQSTTRALVLLESGSMRL